MVGITQCAAGRRFLHIWTLPRNEQTPRQPPHFIPISQISKAWCLSCYPKLHGHDWPSIYFVLMIVPTYWHQLAAYKNTCTVKPGLPWKAQGRVEAGHVWGTPCVLPSWKACGATAEDASAPQTRGASGCFDKSRKEQWMYWIDGTWDDGDCHSWTLHHLRFKLLAHQTGTLCGK